MLVPRHQLQHADQLLLRLRVACACQWDPLPYGSGYPYGQESQYLQEYLMTCSCSTALPALASWAACVANTYIIDSCTTVYRSALAADPQMCTSLLLDIIMMARPYGSMCRELPTGSIRCAGSYRVTVVVVDIVEESRMKIARWVPLAGGRGPAAAAGPTKCQAWEPNPPAQQTQLSKPS